MNKQEKRIVKHLFPKQKKEQPRCVRDDYIFSKVVSSWYFDQVFEKKSPKEIAAFLKRRKSTLLPYDRDKTKYEACREATEQMRTALESNDFDDFTKALYYCKDAMKYQGYLQMKQVFIEKQIEGMSEEQIKALWLAEKL